MNRAIRRKTYDTSTDSSVGRIRRVLASWLGVLLLAANILGAGLLPVRPAEAGPAPFAQDIVGDHVVVCTASGMVVMDRDGHVVDQNGSGHGAFCVFCLPLLHAAMASPAAVSVEATTLASIPPVPFPSAPLGSPRAFTAGATSSRGPPLS